MTDTYNQLNDELSVLYPGVTDTELNEMTSNLIDFFINGTKAIYENKHSMVANQELSSTENNQNKKILTNGFTNESNSDISNNVNINN